MEEKQAKADAEITDMQDTECDDKELSASTVEDSRQKANGRNKCKSFVKKVLGMYIVILLI